MDKRSAEQEKMWVITGDLVATRGSGPKQLKIEDLSINVNMFLNQMGSILEKAPDKVGKFQFNEFEVHAEITAQGTIAVLGSGMQAGASGGLRFVFRRTGTSDDK